jgi:hypothetical protein
MTSKIKIIISTLFLLSLLFGMAQPLPVSAVGTEETSTATATAATIAPTAIPEQTEAPFSRPQIIVESYSSSNQWHYLWTEF